MRSQAQDLSEAERQQIEAEELALARAKAAQQAQQRRRLAAAAYRQEVRSALAPRPFWWPVRWLVPGALLLWAAFGLRPVQLSPMPDSSWGGISNSALMERCRAQVSAQTYGQESDLRFATPQEAADQFSAGSGAQSLGKQGTGKSWNSWAERPDGTRLNFWCNYQAVKNQVTVELRGTAQP